jgi:hypothetical protein
MVIVPAGSSTIFEKFAVRKDQGLAVEVHVSELIPRVSIVTPFETTPFELVE